MEALTAATEVVSLVEVGLGTRFLMSLKRGWGEESTSVNGSETRRREGEGKTYSVTDR